MLSGAWIEVENQEGRLLCKGRTRVCLPGGERATQTCKKCGRTHLLYLGITGGEGRVVYVIMSGLLDSAPVKMPFDSQETYCMCRTMKVNRDVCICQFTLACFAVGYWGNLLLSSHQRWDFLLCSWLLIVLFPLSCQQHPTAELGVFEHCWHKRRGRYLSYSPLESLQPFPVLSIDGKSSEAAGKCWIIKLCLQHFL